MNGSIKYWKQQAKMNLSGHWGSAIAGILAVGAVTFIGNILSIQLFPGSTLWPMVAGQIFVFVFSLIAMVFRAGYSYMLLNMARDREVSLGNLLYLFHNWTGSGAGGRIYSFASEHCGTAAILLCIVYSESREIQKKNRSHGSSCVL